MCCTAGGVEREQLNGSTMLQFRRCEPYIMCSRRGAGAVGRSGFRAEQAGALSGTESNRMAIRVRSSPAAHTNKNLQTIFEGSISL
jgi:hypothetical protein